MIQIFVLCRYLQEKEDQICRGNFVDIECLQLVLDYKIFPLNCLLSCLTHSWPLQFLLSISHPFSDKIKTFLSLF